MLICIFFFFLFFCCKLNSFSKIQQIPNSSSLCAKLLSQCTADCSSFLLNTQSRSDVTTSTLMLYMIPLSIFKFTVQNLYSWIVCQWTTARRNEYSWWSGFSQGKKKNQTSYAFIRILTFSSAGIILVPTNQSYVWMKLFLYLVSGKGKGRLSDFYFYIHGNVLVQSWGLRS